MFFGGGDSFVNCIAVVKGLIKNFFCISHAQHEEKVIQEHVKFTLFIHTATTTSVFSCSNLLLLFHLYKPCRWDKSILEYYTQITLFS